MELLPKSMGRLLDKVTGPSGFFYGLAGVLIFYVIIAHGGPLLRGQSKQPVVSEASILVTQYPPLSREAKASAELCRMNLQDCLVRTGSPVCYDRYFECVKHSLELKSESEYLVLR